LTRAKPRAKPRANASRKHQEQPKSNSHLTQKVQESQETQAPEGHSFALLCAGWKFPKTPPDPIGKIRFKVGTLWVARIGVCVPFAPLASFALNGSVNLDALDALDAFALAVCGLGLQLAGMGV
jgi:hypothetical protein